MAFVRKRGETFTITASLGYREDGTQIRKNTTYKPPAGVTPGKAEKLAREYAAVWEDQIRGFTSLDENITFAKLSEWYFTTVAPSTLKPNVLVSHKGFIEHYALPTLARKKLKEITPVMLDSLFQELKSNGRVHALTYRLKDSNLIPVGRQREIAKGSGLGDRTIYLYRNGGNAKKENAEKVAAYMNIPFADLFELVEDNKGLSMNTVIRIKNCISAILQTAVKKEILRRNPCINTVKLERPRLAESYLDEEQALTLITGLNDQPDYQFKAMVLTLIFTGMRAGELVGLTWDKLDLEKGIIYVKYTLAYVNDLPRRNKHILQETKTKGSERYIVIPDSLVEVLKEHKARLEERKEALGDKWAGRKTVFPTPTGDYYYTGYLNTKIKMLIAKLGLPEDLHTHSLRHTNASLLINADVPAKVISEQLGHASTQITQDIYAHIFASSKAKAMRALELKLGGALGKAAPDGRPA